MKRALLTGIAIGAGIAATLGSAYVGWSVLRPGVNRLQRGRESFGGKVEVNFRVIRYREPACYLELTWEPIDCSAPIAYVPSPRRWRVRCLNAHEIVEAASSRRSKSRRGT